MAGGGAVNGGGAWLDGDSDIEFSAVEFQTDIDAKPDHGEATARSSDSSPAEGTETARGRRSRAAARRLGEGSKAPTLCQQRAAVVAQGDGNCGGTPTAMNVGNDEAAVYEQPTALEMAAARSKRWAVAVICLPAE